MTLHIGLLLFPRVQQLDMTGPYDVFAHMADTKVHLVWKTREPVRSSAGMILTPDVTYADCPVLDVLCVPGGSGVGDLMEDEETLAFLREQAAGARYVTSVCTGSLVLGAAGLLRGKRATTHWAYHDLLPDLGAIPVHERVVRDGNLFTGGGITAGIDFALTLAAELVGEHEAQAIQLQMEYAPAPPFDSGDPARAPAAVANDVRERCAPSLAARSAITARVAERLKSHA
ncbi:MULTISPECIES: DJ-1/PfpI family protein [Caballeronia]|jgi:cyclohexyl-isocyanide hydratase|uniref:Dimethylglycine dehydrogenase n=1 Tax=Caballeronia zhejiangensis TaxID=871203 RepID=A0A656QNH3_9BURK|nr:MULTISPECIES: DJ-1/PfpI family protein [Caballeronia]EKS66416.1 Pfpi family intracellular protease [Burkholderia sp. SJ98]KDR30119.1 dimethylglycine dehydrogenase [Caballeronia zhejiangensis]MDR5789018.1 DJ-1/PfpI family protein [Caballeronia sp. LP003]